MLFGAVFLQCDAKNDPSWGIRRPSPRRHRRRRAPSKLIAKDDVNTSTSKVKAKRPIEELINFPIDMDDEDEGATSLYRASQLDPSADKDDDYDKSSFSKRSEDEGDLFTGAGKEALYDAYNQLHTLAQVSRSFLEQSDSWVEPKLTFVSALRNTTSLSMLLRWWL